MTCGQRNHGLHHFLLCDSEICCNKSEAFWNRRKARKDILHLVTVEDMDFSDIENIEDIVDEMEDKTECNDVYVVQNLFIPVMRVSENNDCAVNIQTFFLMEKVLVNLPTVGTKEIILIYDSGSGRTVGNKIESLDHLQIPKFTDLVLSSLNGIDKSRKRVCEINVHQQTWDSCSFDVICPQDKIPTPYPQSMKTFKR